MQAGKQAVLQKIDNKFGRIDILVNNAGVAPKVRIDILETTEENFDYVLDINLKGTFFLSQLVARYMIQEVKKMPASLRRLLTFLRFSEIHCETC